ncbi:hypothetical protein RJT34_12032 [Clitoria ternatea]|uniref:Uncharacterized protein n=1 Tax=Clitoria ternatea TaxID=43366 RepID=A0AAN9JN51_CLITE
MARFLSTEKLPARVAIEESSGSGSEFKQGLLGQVVEKESSLALVPFAKVEYGPSSIVMGSSKQSKPG